MAMIDKQPKVCNICNSKNVIFTTNDIIYGKKYGSGYCYYCQDCKSYVGTHKNNHTEAMGILSDKKMRNLKKLCHYVFDKFWSNNHERHAMYKKLSVELGIPFEECHFGYFDFTELLKAFSILKRWESEKYEQRATT